MAYISYSEAINDALSIALKNDPGVIVYGLGTTDPKNIFGTTKNLQKEFGSKRVFDVPTSENALTGIGIGAAIGGLKPVLVHQRLDFSFLSLDQIINNAAKWKFMFGGKRSVPFTIRMIVGRGWGQGPTHSQSLHALFAMIPGLKVVMPSTPFDAKGLLLSSIFDPDPTIFIEHRWLHDLKDEVPSESYRVAIGEPRIVRNGDMITLVSSSYMTVEAMRAVDFLASKGIKAELIDLRTIRPINYDLIHQSIRKTGRALVIDQGHLTGGISAEILATIIDVSWNNLKEKPRRMAMPDFPESTSMALTRDYHITARQITDTIIDIFGLSGDYKYPSNSPDILHDVPNREFSGPF